MGRPAPRGRSQPPLVPGDQSIKSKLTSMVMLTSLAGLLMACLGFALYDYSTFREEKVRELASFAEIIAASSAKSLDSVDATAAGEIIGSLPGDRNILAACLYSAEGALLTGFVSREGSSDACPSRGPSHGHEFSYNRLRLSHPAVLSGKTAGTVLLISGLDDIWTRMIRYVLISGVVLLASVAAAFAASSRLRSIISDPILKLAKTARSISIQQDFSVRVEKNAGGEVGLLTDAFNEMLTQIQHRDEELRKAKGDLEQRYQEKQSQLQQEADGRHQAEEALREREEALRRPWHAEGTAGPEEGAARELESLLVSIKGYAEALATSMAGDESLEGWVKEIRESALRAAALSRQLLTPGDATAPGGPAVVIGQENPGTGAMPESVPRREPGAVEPPATAAGPGTEEPWPAPAETGTTGPEPAAAEPPRPEAEAPPGEEGGVNPLDVPAEETEEELVLSLEP